MKQVTPLLVVVDGQQCLTIDGVALLLGIADADDIDRNGWRDTANLPLELIQRGHHRGSEADANTGDGSLASRLTYWAQKDHGAEIVTEDGNLYMITTAGSSGPPASQ